jgi:hypothetical protein
MGFLGSKAKITPNLDGLARQSLIFERAYSQAPLTVVSHATILTGIYPQTHRASEFGARLAFALPFVPDLLRAGGYRTAAFVGSIALDPKSGLAPGFDRGFSVYDAGFQLPEHGPGRNASIDRSAAQVAARAAAWLARNPEGPFFLWVHLNDPEAASGSAYNAAVSGPYNLSSRLYIRSGADPSGYGPFTAGAVGGFYIDNVSYQTWNSTDPGTILSSYSTGFGDPSGVGDLSSAPEPGSISLLGIGLGILMYCRRASAARSL